MNLDRFYLSPVMKHRAEELLDAFPSVQVLSGRRTLEDQAHAMACNVVTDRYFIAKTYLHAAKLQTALDHHLDAQTVSEIEDVLYQTMLRMESRELSQVSDHLNGDAVDLLPMEDAQGVMTPTGSAVYKWIHDCPDTKKFLTREAGLVRWHWACKPSVEV